MKPLLDATVRYYFEHTLKPLFRHAIHTMGLRTFGATLIRYGISCVRGDGMTPQEVRDEIVEPELAEAKPG